MKVTTTITYDVEDNGCDVAIDHTDGMSVELLVYGINTLMKQLCEGHQPPGCPVMVEGAQAWERFANHVLQSEIVTASDIESNKEELN